MTWRWALTISLLLTSLIYANGTLSYWWAGSGPPTQNPKEYIFWGNIYFIVNCLFFLVFVILLVKNIYTVSLKNIQTNPIEISKIKFFLTTIIVLWVVLFAEQFITLSPKLHTGFMIFHIMAMVGTSSALIFLLIARR